MFGSGDDYGPQYFMDEDVIIGKPKLQQSSLTKEEHNK